MVAAGCAVVIVSNEDARTVRVETGVKLPDAEERNVRVSTGVTTSVVISDTDGVEAAGVSEATADLHGTDTVTIELPTIETLEHYSWVTVESVVPAATVASLMRILTWLLRTRLSSVDATAPTIELTSPGFPEPMMFDNVAAS